MIIANNFGATAADINVKALQSYDFLLFDGTIVVNTTTQAYKMAETLELTLKGCLLPDSVPAALYITANSNGKNVITVAKAQLVNCTTLRIEKIARWSKFASYVIRLQSIFFPRGREIELGRNLAYRVNFINPSSHEYYGNGAVFRWGGMIGFHCAFYRLSTVAPETPVELTTINLDEIPEVPVLLIYNDPSLEADGSGYVEATIGNGKLCVPNGLPALANGAPSCMFIKGFYIEQE